MTITYREGNIEDSHSVFQVFVKSIMDYSKRMGVMAITGGNDQNAAGKQVHYHSEAVEHIRAG